MGALFPATSRAPPAVTTASWPPRASFMLEETLHVGPRREAAHRDAERPAGADGVESHRLEDVRGAVGVARGAGAPRGDGDAGLVESEEQRGRGSLEAFEEERGVPGDIAQPLSTITGKANIYYNDLMPFYTLLRFIPSHDVSLKKEFVSGATNVIAVPREYSDNTNWHDDFWLLPVPSARGEYVPMGKTRKNFGNVVPTAFYMGIPGVAARQQGSAEIHKFAPHQNIALWARLIGKQHEAYPIPAKEAVQHYVSSAGSSEGLCVFETQGGVLFWHIDTRDACRSTTSPY